MAGFAILTPAPGDKMPHVEFDEGPLPQEGYRIHISKNDIDRLQSAIRYLGDYTFDSIAGERQLVKVMNALADGARAVCMAKEYFFDLDDMPWDLARGMRELYSSVPFGTPVPTPIKRERMEEARVYDAAVERMWAVDLTAPIASATSKPAETEDAQLRIRRQLRERSERLAAEKAELDERERYVREEAALLEEAREVERMLEL